MSTAGRQARALATMKASSACMTLTRRMSLVTQSDARHHSPLRHTPLQTTPQRATVRDTVLRSSAQLSWCEQPRRTPAKPTGHLRPDGASDQRELPSTAVLGYVRARGPVYPRGPQMRKQSTERAIK